MSTEQPLVYIGLGSNLGDSITTLRSALMTLHSHPAIHQLQVSRLYRSKPIGPQDQPDYWNAAACFHTPLTPQAVLTLLLTLEQQHGREREKQVHWGARTLDLDVLLYDQLMITTPDLIIPHPYLIERAFVVYPLMDLNSDLILPSGKLLKDYLSLLQAQASTLQVSDLTLLYKNKN